MGWACSQLGGCFLLELRDAVWMGEGAIIADAMGGFVCRLVAYHLLGQPVAGL